jgi:hypothetical protein
VSNEYKFKCVGKSGLSSYRKSYFDAGAQGPFLFGLKTQSGLRLELRDTLVCRSRCNFGQLLFLSHFFLNVDVPNSRLGERERQEMIHSRWFTKEKYV